MCGATGRRRVCIGLDRGAAAQAASPPASTRTRGRPAFISTRAAAMADSSFGQSQKTMSSRPSEKSASRDGSSRERDADGAGDGTRRPARAPSAERTSIKRRACAGGDGLAQRVDVDALDVLARASAMRRCAIAPCDEGDEHHARRRPRP